MTNDIRQDALTAAVLVVLDTQIRPLLAVHGGGLELIEVTPAGEVRLAYEGACRGCSLKSVTYALGIRQKLTPIPGVSEVTVSFARGHRASGAYVSRLRALGRLIEIVLSGGCLQAPTAYHQFVKATWA